MNKVRVIVIIIASWVFLYQIAKILTPKNHQLFAHLFNQNSITVSAEDNLKIEEVKIELFTSCNVTIYHLGHKNEIPKEYGENDWTVYYGRRKSGTFRLFQTNNWHDNEYNFRFFTENDSVKCQVVINGPNKRNFDIALKTN
jgi:hypothetical protein